MPEIVSRSDLVVPFAADTGKAKNANLLALIIHDGTNIIDVVSGETANAATTPVVYAEDAVGIQWRNAAFNLTDLSIGALTSNRPITIAIHGVFRQSANGTSGDTVQMYTGLNLSGNYMDFKSDDNWGNPSKNEVSGAYNTGQADSTLDQTDGTVQAWGLLLNKSSAYMNCDFYGQGQISTPNRAGHADSTGDMQSIGFIRGSGEERAYIIAIFEGHLSLAELQEFDDNPYDHFVTTGTAESYSGTLTSTANSTAAIQGLKLAIGNIYSESAPQATTAGIKAALSTITSQANQSASVTGFKGASSTVYSTNVSASDASGFKLSSGTIYSQAISSATTSGTSAELIIKSGSAISTTPSTSSASGLKSGLGRGELQNNSQLTTTSGFKSASAEIRVTNPTFASTMGYKAALGAIESIADLSSYFYGAKAAVGQINSTTQSQSAAVGYSDTYMPVVLKVRIAGDIGDPNIAGDLSGAITIRGKL